MQNFCQLWRQAFVALLPQFLWYTIECLGDASGDSRKCVAVTTEGDRRAESVFKIRAFQKCSDSLWYSLLTALHMMISGANFIAAAAEVVAKLALRIRFDLCFTLAGASEEDRRSDSLHTLDALWMIMRHLGSELRQMQRLLHTLRQPRRR